MKIGRIPLFVCLLLVVTAPSAWLVAQDLDNRFEPLEVEGKSELRRVSCLVQDHLGFMWMGTSNGLFRFDGYELKAYQNNPDKVSSLPDNYVYALYEDSQQRLWVGTEAGLAYFDRDHDDFRIIRTREGDPGSLSNNSVISICETEDGDLWVGTKAGLNRIHLREKDLRAEKAGQNDFYTLQRFDFTDDRSIHVMLRDQLGQVWLGTHAGLFQLNAEGKLLKRFDEVQGGTGNSVITSLHALAGGKLLMGTSSGLRLFDPLMQRFEPVPFDPKGRFDLQTRSIKVITEDNRGQIWVGTSEGDLFQIDPNTKEVLLHQIDGGEDALSLISDEILAVYIDRSGLLWVSSYLHGVYQLDLIRISFGVAQHSSKPGSLLSDAVNAIAEDEEGYVWIGTDKGLSLLDKSTETHRYFQHLETDSTSLSDDAVYSLLRDRKGNMWVGTLDGGLDFLSAAQIARQNFDFRSYRYDPENPSGLLSDEVLTLMEDQQGRIWIGTAEGLNSLDPEKGTILAYRHISSNTASLSDNTVKALFQDRKGVIWIGTEHGLNSLTPNLDEGSGFSRYLRVEGDTNTLSTNSILVIEEDERGYLWIGTEGGGLCSLSPDRQQFQSYTSADGLPDNSICGILFDKESSLWLSTTSGISRMKRRGDSDSYSFINYDKNNWLPFDQFNPGAFFQNSRGFMYYGSSRGLIYFHPDLISENEFPPPVVITSLELTYLSAEERKAAHLPVNIGETRSLDLPYRYNNMIFRFAALSFLNSERNEYAYMLEGYNNEWQYVKSQRAAPFTNLDPGTYTFRVKAANNHGRWNEVGTSIELTISPPFYLTKAFLAFCAALAVLIVLAYGKIRTRELEKNKKTLEAKVEERTREVQRQKEELETILENLKSTQSQLVESEKMASLGLLTAGVAHEINNPINFVSGNVEPLKRDINDLLKIMEAYAQKVEEKQLQADFGEVMELRNELDYDFLVEEIDSLLGGIQEGARRTSEIVKGLRNFSRLDEDDRKLTNVNEGLESTLLILGSEFRERIEVVKNLGEIPEVFGYPGKLNQVFMNIITNAVQAIEGRGTIYIDTTLEDACVKISIRDTGKGMAEEVRQRVFDPFFTTKEVGHGTGLGLSISFGIIENHQGRISVKSKPGEGSEFDIYLPVHPS